MRSLFYFGELKNGLKELNGLLCFIYRETSIHPIPIIRCSRYTDVLKTGADLFLLMEVPDNIMKIKWRRFKVPGSNKFKSIILFKYSPVYSVLKDEKSATFKLTKQGDVGWIDLDQEIINLPEIPDLFQEEKDLVVKLAAGKLDIFPSEFIKKEQVMTL